MSALRWGFRCQARGVVLQSLPWLLDLECTLAGLGSRLATSLLVGEKPTEQEHTLASWFDSSLMSAGLDHYTTITPSSTPTSATGTTASSLTSFVSEKLESKVATTELSPLEAAAMQFLHAFVEGKSEAKLLLTEVCIIHFFF
jgi:hypothetical protein